MYGTCEIRWFFEDQKGSVQEWFDSFGFDTFERQEDFYLRLKKNDLSIKLRDDNVEIKHLIGSRAKGRAGPKAWGYFENWIKWSFNSDNVDAVIAEIIEGEPKYWVPVIKERHAVKLAQNGNAITFHPITVNLDHGCQIEYTKIQIFREYWYSIGLEWFGDSRNECDSTTILERIGDTELIIKQSMGYPGFLSGLSLE